ncbi:MAG: hypothetical protein ACOC2U_00535, partial [bacterium]
KLLNKDLYNEKTYLEKQIKIQASTIQSLKMKGNVVTKYDTIIYHNDYIDSNTTRFNFFTEKKDSVVNTKVTIDIDVRNHFDSLTIINKNINSEFNVHNLKLSIITGYRRKGLFRRNEQFITAVTTNDERFTITDIDSWTDSDYEKKSFIHIKPGLFAGVIYDPFNKQFNTGIGISLTLSRGK